MDDLPNAKSNTSPPVNPQPAGVVGSMAKEVAPIVGAVEAPLMAEVGKDTELSPEVRMAGVSMKSDSIELPHIVQKMGVSAVGPAAPPASQVAAITLPLTDDQIAQGLHQSLMSSWRWLAEWCERQLKQAHILLTSAKGKTTRSTTE
ncbi:hypothetical protein HZB58_00865 [Candidatus Gottesmanbacteria bacterium]|nr:hypothetical protein [Candidatus Gottesmanbacteria bacterium]